MEARGTASAATDAARHGGGEGRRPGEARTLAAAALLVAGAALAIAIGFEVVGGFVPCALCLEQRVGYYAAIPLAAVALATMGAVPALARALLVGAGAALLWSGGLGVYHAGAEWGFWAGPADCGGSDAAARDASSLLTQMAATRLVSCTEAAYRFLGLSFAGWNVLAAGTAAALALAAATRPVPNRRGRP